MYCVNDGAVMKAWSDDQNLDSAAGFITMMGDPTSELTVKLDMILDHPGPQGKGLINRSKCRSQTLTRARRPRPALSCLQHASICSSRAQNTINARPSPMTYALFASRPPGASPSTQRMALSRTSSSPRRHTTRQARTATRAAMVGPPFARM